MIGTPLPLAPDASANSKATNIAIALVAILMLIVIAAAAFLLFRQRSSGT